MFSLRIARIIKKAHIEIQAVRKLKNSFRRSKVINNHANPKSFLSTLRVDLPPCISMTLLPIPGAIGQICPDPRPQAMNLVALLK